MQTYKIGLMGYGYLGSSLHKSLLDEPVSVSRVYNRTAGRLNNLPDDVSTTDMETFLDGVDSLDLVVELAHPDITLQAGDRILQSTDYMPCSVTALADDALRKKLVERAGNAGTRLLVPHGAVVGIDSMHEYRGEWESVTVTFRKPPAALDAGDEVQRDETVLFDGSVREAAAKFPRNVNAMVACALATLGVDETRARVVADTRQGNVLRGEFEFRGRDGSTLSIVKQEPAEGVSSPGMILSLKGSVLRALSAGGDGIAFV